MGDFDEEIEKILQNIEKKEYLELKNFEANRDIAIENIFKRFMRYERNIENKKKAYETLKTYRAVMPEDLKKGDCVSYLNTREFYDIQLCYGGKFLGFSKAGDIIVSRGMFIFTIQPTIFFIKITNKDIVKIKLMELVDKL